MDWPPSFARVFPWTFFCIFVYKKTQEDIKNIIFIEVLRGVRFPPCCEAPTCDGLDDLSEVWPGRGAAGGFRV